MKVQFVRVLDVRSADSYVLAMADGHRVRWKPKKHWDCDCLAGDGLAACDHIKGVHALINPRVLTNPEKENPDD